MLHHRRQPAITTIMLDRSSELSGNQLTVDTLWQPRGLHTIAATLAQTLTASTDLLDTALSHYIQLRGIPATKRPLHEFTFTPTLGVSGTLRHHGAHYTLSLKGMPEQLLRYCDLSDNEHEAAMIQLHKLSETGRYVVAVASGLIDRPIKQLAELKTTEKLSLVGFVSLQLTIPSSTKQLVHAVGSRGTRIYLVTGQHQVAAYHTALQLGLTVARSDVYDARQLDVTVDDHVAGILGRVQVIARATPAHKAQIYSALQSLDPTTMRVDTLVAMQQILTK